MTDSNYVGFKPQKGIGLHHWASITSLSQLSGYTVSNPRRGLDYTTRVGTVLLGVGMARFKPQKGIGLHHTVSDVRVPVQKVLRFKPQKGIGLHHKPQTSSD